MHFFLIMEKWLHLEILTMLLKNIFNHYPEIFPENNY
jgi:hypothetical protein